MSLNDYVFRDIKLPPPKKLVWNVFIESNREIKVYNIFEHGGFLNSLVKAKKKLQANLKVKKEKDAIEEFKEEVWHILSYYFWAKCEWEVIITDWPTHVKNEELTRLVEERDERKAKGYSLYGFSVNLSVEEKIDVKTQIAINWYQFIQYVLDNLKLIKPPKYD